MPLENSYSYEEKELLQQIAKGDTTAFARVFERHRARIFFIAWKLLKSDEAAEDALQEVFTTIWVNRAKLPAIDNFKSYLNTITRNHLFNRLRKKINEEKFLRDHLSIGATHSDQIVDEVFWRQLEMELQTALRQLPVRQRTVFELSRFEGRKHEDIAQIMGISKETVKKHIMEAMRNIRGYFEKAGFDGGLIMLLLTGSFILS